MQIIHFLFGIHVAWLSKRGMRRHNQWPQCTNQMKTLHMIDIHHSEDLLKRLFSAWIYDQFGIDTQESCLWAVVTDEVIKHTVYSMDPTDLITYAWNCFISNFDRCIPRLNKTMTEVDGIEVLDTNSIFILGLLRHILSPLHNLPPATNCAYVGGTLCRPCAQYYLTPGDKMCCSGTYVLGRQNVPCGSTHFVVPHWMDLNIHSDIYVVNTKEAIHYNHTCCMYII